jgi:hypothetical protein
MSDFNYYLLSKPISYTLPYPPSIHPIFIYAYVNTLLH